MAWQISPEQRALLTLGAALLLAAAAWLPALGSSYWLDECVTAWFVEGDLQTLLRRAGNYSGGQPASFLAPWLSQRLLGPSEQALRLPSVLAMLACVLLLARLVRRYSDAETAAFAALLFVVLPIVAFEGRNARPYAQTLLLLVLACERLSAWSRYGGLWRALCAGGCAGLVLHFQMLLSLGLFALPLFAWEGLRSRRPRTVGEAAGAFATAAAVAAAAWPSLLRTYERSEELVHAPPLGINETAATVLPPAASLGLVLAVAGLRAAFGSAGAARTTRGGERWLALAGALWLAMPTVVLFLLSRQTPLHLVLPRYLIPTSLGFALLAALLVTRALSSRARLILVGLLVLAGLRYLPQREHSFENWRAASARLAEERVASGGPELAIHHAGGLIESSRPSYFASPERRAYLTVGLQTHGVRHGIVVLPFSLEPEWAEAHLQAVWADVVAQQRPFLLIQRFPDAPHFDRYREALAPLGFSPHELPGAFGSLRVFRFDPPGEK